VSAPSAAGSQKDRIVWKRTIGIVGGLGPFAHLEFERLLLQEVERLIGGPAQDQDFPNWILASVPDTPDRTLAVQGLVPSPLDSLERAVRWLGGTPDEPGAEFAVIACNSAHAWLDELARRVDLPILDMISETLGAARDLAGDEARVGLLATTGTLEAGIYHSALKRLGGRLTLLSPLDLRDGDLSGEEIQEQTVMSAIYGPLRDGRRTGGGIKSGNTSGSVEPLRRAVDLLAAAGAEIVVTACTEIPLALGREPVGGLPLLDPMQVAAEAAVAIAAGRRPLP
jgi:aspartate racemase